MANGCKRRSPRQSVIVIIAARLRSPYKIRGAVLRLCGVLDGTDVRLATVVAVVEDEVGLGRDILTGCHGSSVDHRVHIHRGVVDGSAIECRVVGIALYEDGAHGVDKARIGMVVTAVVAEDGDEQLLQISTEPGVLLVQRVYLIAAARGCTAVRTVVI